MQFLCTRFNDTRMLKSKNCELRNPRVVSDGRYTFIALNTGRCSILTYYHFRILRIENHILTRKAVVAHRKDTCLVIKSLWVRGVTVRGFESHLVIAFFNKRDHFSVVTVEIGLTKSVLASHPAALGSILGIPRNSLGVPEIYCRHF